MRLAGFFLLGGVAAEGVEFDFGLNFGVGEGLGDGGVELLAGGVTLGFGASEIEFRGGAGLGEGSGVGLGSGGGRDFEFAALLGGDTVAEVFFLGRLVEFEALQHGGVEAVAQGEGVPAGRAVDGLGERETEVGGAHDEVEPAMRRELRAARLAKPRRGFGLEGWRILTFHPDL